MEGPPHLSAVQAADGADDEPVVLGLDLGTTGAKAVAVGRHGSVLAQGGREYPLARPQPGWAEQDPDQVAEAAFAVLAEVSGALRQAGLRPAGLALSGAMHSLLPLDAASAPLGPAVTWADRRAEPQAARLRAEGRAQELYARSGTPVHPMSPLAKLLWFREHSPQVWAAAARWVAIRDYVLLRLTGALACDESGASASGLYSLGGRNWDPSLLQLVGLRPAQLPPVVPVTATVGTLTAAVGARCGLPAGLPVVAGASDGACATIGVGAVRPGDAACSIGTSGAVRALASAPAVDPQGRVFCYAVDGRHWLVGGAVNNGGNVLRWLGDALAPDLLAAAREQGRSHADDEVLALAAGAPPGCDGLLMLPYLHGERAPRWTGGLTGAYLGLTSGHSRAHLARAALEGVCLAVSTVLTAMPAAPATRIVATGGFAHSPFWVQLLADVLGVRVELPAGEQGSATGAALLGHVGLGTLPSLEAAAATVRITRTVEPDPVRAALYREVAARFAAAADLVPDLPGPPGP